MGICEMYPSLIPPLPLTPAANSFEPGLESSHIWGCLHSPNKFLSQNTNIVLQTIWETFSGPKYSISDSMSLGGGKESILRVTNLTMSTSSPLSASFSCKRSQ